jgi:FkbM family methyltransferase
MVLNAISENNSDYTNVEKNIHKGVNLYGAGQFGQLMLEYLSEKKYKVECFLDNSPEKQERSIHSLKVKKADEFSKGVILITARRAIAEIKASLKTIDLPVMSFESWFVIKNIKKYAYIRNNVFSDEFSKNVLDTLLYVMLTNKNHYFSSICIPEQYFCLAEFVSGYNEHFVDVGAYVGDIIETFIWKKLGSFDKIYAFEPMEKQYKAMVIRTKRLINEWGIDDGKIVLEKAGISDVMQKQFISIDKNRVNGSVFFDDDCETQNREEISIYTLDNYFKDKKVTFIKADIEGYEMKMLKGAENVIKKYKPKMALCVYHKLTDMFDFIDYLQKIVPEYTFRLRHHSYNSTETVLYCNI